MRSRRPVLALSSVAALLWCTAMLVTSSYDYPTLAFM